MPELTVAQVAQMRGVDQSTVRRWILAGQLSARRIGARVLVIDESEARNFQPQPVGNPEFTRHLQK